MIKEKKFFHALALALFFSWTITAQGIQNNEIVNKSQSLRIFKMSSDKIEGTPYVAEEFLPATLSNSDKVYSVKYNAFLDQMEILTEGSTKALPMMFNYTIDFVGMNKRYQVFSKEDGKNSFFVVLYTGNNVALLAKEIVKFEEEVQPNTGYDKYKPPTFKRQKNRYYIGFKNSTSSMLPTKKKDFYAKFGKHENAIKKYVKSNKLNYKKEADLVTIFSYYDTL